MHGTTNMIFVPDKHIEFVCASSNNQIIGRALFCNFLDEVNFDARSANVERQKARLKQIISQVDARMASRFLRGDFLPTLKKSALVTNQVILILLINYFSSGC